MLEENSGQGQVQPGAEGQGNNQPQLYEYVVNGESKKASLDQLIAFAQKGEDYTQKTQRLSEERKQLDSLVNTKAEELALKMMEELSSQNGQGNTQSQNDGQTPDEFKALREEMAQLKQSHANLTSAQEAKVYDEYLDKMESKFKGQFPNMDWEKVLVNFAKSAQEGDNPEEILANLAKESHEGTEKMKRQIIDEFVKAKSNPNVRSGEFGASGSPSGSVPKEPPKTFAEARERADARFAQVQ